MDAGLAEEQFGKDMTEGKGSNVGVYVGLCNNEWVALEEDRHSPYASMSHAGASAANRLSFLLNLLVLPWSLTQLALPHLWRCTRPVKHYNEEIAMLHWWPRLTSLSLRPL